MGVVHRYVFPTIRILLWAAIAVSLAKIAFTGATTDPDGDPLTPSAEIIEPTVTVGTGDVVNVVTVPGTVVADPAAPVRATGDGTVSAVLVTDGQTVAVGTALLEVRKEVPQEPTVRTDPVTGEQSTTERPPRVVKETVASTAAGTARLTVLKGQAVAVGDTVGSVDPGTLSVTGTLTAEQQYRLLTVPAEAEVTLAGGPAPFTCTGLRIGSPPSGDSGGEVPAGDPATTVSGALTCAVPAGTVAFPGLGASIAVTNGSATEVVVVPTTAVEGSVQQGNVWVVSEPGAEPEKRAVTLGLTDGTQVQVTEGLAEGEEVLEFAPVERPADPAIPCGEPGADPMVCGG